MWSLIMGAVQSSGEEETSPEIHHSKTRDSGSSSRGEPPHLTSSQMSLEPGSVPQRQQGDGMEVPTAEVNKKPGLETARVAIPQPPPAEVTTPVIEAGLKAVRVTVKHPGDSGAPPCGIFLPETGLTLAKLPPIEEKVDLRPRPAQSALVPERPKVYPRGTLPPAVKKAREPKFVPYEPYKGAVKSFVTPGGRQRGGRRTTTSPEKKLCTTASQVSVDQTDQCDQPGEEDEESKQEISPELEQNYRALLEVKEQELVRLRRSLENSEKQLKIQTQVNHEVKKLLVASVGEDIEARVDFLTQDKARLAADVIQYNNKISRDWEEKEALHVESDVWRSKFLASTLIVEEVTRGKQVYAARCEELEHCARRLLVERNQLRSSLTAAQSVISTLLTSFDPLAVTSPAAARREDNAAPPSSHGDILGLADSLTARANCLGDRLLGESRRRSIGSLPGLHQVDTPAERELKKLLASSPAGAECRVPEEASNSLSKGARHLLLKLGDQAQSPGGGKSDFSTCSHCHGSVQVV